jgi:hypothetical protein
LKFIAREIRQEEEIKGIQVRKKEVKLSLIADDMILYLKDLKNSTKNPLGTITTSSKVAGYKINIQKSILLLYNNNEQTAKEIMKTMPLEIP